MLSTTILVPAYGVTYATASEALRDWKAGKDFRVLGHSCYASIRNIAKMQAQLCTVYIRLNNIRASIVVSNH